MDGTFVPFEEMDDARTWPWGLDAYITLSSRSRNTIWYLPMSIVDRQGLDMIRDAIRHLAPPEQSPALVIYQNA